MTLAPRRAPRLPPRAPLLARKRAERREARRRIAQRARVPLGAARRAFDPLARRLSRPARAARALGALLGSAGLHAGIVLLGVLVGARSGAREAIRQRVDVEVRERRTPPPPPAPPEPEVAPPPRAAAARPAADAPPIRPPPVEAPKGPPPRVVGISLDSTADGGGPAFAVGNTRLGETAERAFAPEDVPPIAPPPSAAPPDTTNRTASRIPTLGARYVLPRRRAPVKPPYPETLKSQGVEADVTVMVTIDAAGRVTSVKLIREAPYPEFNEAARAAALAEVYEPAMRDGVAIPYTLSFTYQFRLEDE